jgi:hypothetical protein
MSDELFTPELNAREIRALCHAANMMGAVFQQVLESDVDLASLTAPGVPPLQSAAMKLELVLITHGVELA